MFALTVRMKARADKLEEFKGVMREYIATIRKNEPGNIMFKTHHRVDDPTELLFYEAYKDRAAWADIHMKQPYVAKLIEALPKYRVGDSVMEEYEELD